jgi:hypothetical protein
VEYAACSGDAYLSLNYHHGSPDGKKSKWAIKRGEECQIFCHAQGERWQDDDLNLWSVSEGAKDCYGKENERMAFFDGSGGLGSWHGYPVSGRIGSSTRRRPPQPVVLQWRTSGRINQATYERIMSGRL